MKLKRSINGPALAFSLSLLTTLLASCRIEFLPGRQQASPSPSPTDAASPIPSVTPSAPPSPSPTPSPAPSPIPPRPVPPPIVQAPRQDATCITTNYVSRIDWQGDNAFVTFGRKPSATAVQNAPATVTRNVDGSLTYGFSAENTTYTRIYPNNTCFVQVVRSNNAVVLEESGVLGSWNPPRPSPTPSPSPSPTPDEPEPDDLSMTCAGSIQNDVDFTAYFTRESGFSRLELRPRTSENLLTANLSYSGKNGEGQDIWRGSVNNMADVTIVHLSNQMAKLGDQISVGYDGRWGRATCQ